MLQTNIAQRALKIFYIPKAKNKAIKLLVFSSSKKP